MCKWKFGLLMVGAFLCLPVGLAQGKSVTEEEKKAESESDKGWVVRAQSSVYAIAAMKPQDTTADEDYAAAAAADIIADLPRASALYRRAADKGHLLAQLRVAALMVAVYPEDAVKYYRMAADQGSAVAQMGLGGLYETGRGGLKKNNVEARNWFMKAAEQGDAGGISAIAASYYAGRFGYDESKRNTPEAVEWLQRAAVVKDIKAADAIIEGYKIGRYGLPVDAAKVTEWELKKKEIFGIKEEKVMKKKKLRQQL
ncbi:MAG: sel1 repeat family protein [Nitrosomonadales bacterium]|nr:sel1 repeat family protein [Nitrosomonadales bacterium]